MKPRKFSRRAFLAAGLLTAPCVVVADVGWLEPQWVKIRRLRLAQGNAAHRFVHFTDLHHKGDRAHTQSVVDMINSLKPDFVCFTGDIMEEAKFLPEALELLSGVKAPMYGVPGNHDFWSRAPFGDIIKCFAATGGGWLINQQHVIADGKINVIGVALFGRHTVLPSVKPGMKNILLMHYPAWVKQLNGGPFDLILAGHSHGGQVRIPFYGPLIVPHMVDEYDLGLFHTPAGPLYVNPGIGWYPVPIRFNCRPEITVFEI
jgi:predicted MPP superfamily phosphohydrolase